MCKEMAYIVKSTHLQTFYNGKSDGSEYLFYLFIYLVM